MNLSQKVKSFQEALDEIDESWNLSLETLQKLGFDEEMQQKIRETGATGISLTKEKLEIDLHWLKEIARHQEIIGSLAVPQQKLADFLIEDFEEGLDYIHDRKWFRYSIAPDAAKQVRKFKTHIDAQMSKRKRLMNAYKRYLPTLTPKLQNLVAKLEAETKALESQRPEAKD